MEQKIEKKNHLPWITIVTPSYNQGEFLEECIDSVLSQNYPNLQYIVLDGGSGDNSLEIIKKYENHFSFWRSAPDDGQYPAIDEGFKKSRGTILGWINSDDKFHPESLFKTAFIFNENKRVNWITGRPTVWNKNGGIEKIYKDLPLWSREKYLNLFFKKQCIQQESTFFKKSLYEKAGNYISRDYKFASDLELWVRFFRFEKLYTSDTILGGFRIHDNQKTSWCIEDYLKESEEVIRQELKLLENGNFSYNPKPPEILN